MALQPAGWYNDPTHAYTYRYWNGTAWSNQVSSGGTTGTDPNPLDTETAATPPAPGSEAPSSPQPAAPSVQVTQSSSGSAFGVIFGLLIAVIAVVVLVFVLVNASSDDTPVPTTSGTVATTTTAAS